MKKLFFLQILLLVLFLVGCDAEGEGDIGPSTTDASFEAGGSEGSSGNGQNNQSGLVTAGEWNDLNNWSFWTNLLTREEFSEISNYWEFYTNNRVSVKLFNNSVPVIDAKVELFRNGILIWTSKTDNFGKAELWIGLNQLGSSIDMSEYSLSINGQTSNTALKLYENGVNEISVNFTSQSSNRVELAFIVDATSSMADELEFLKDDLENVIQRVKSDKGELEIYTSSIFYRDIGDEYVTRKSDFSNNLDNTINFIKNQFAEGGGDYPEAVHTALSLGVKELQWSGTAKTRIVFLLLDAPPHYESQIVDDLHSSIKIASEKGIKIIPIVASGIDKQTEFLMRFFSISTNGTYVFITNDSGIGNNHLEASVGEYQVEFLNNLMVRLIEKYTE